MKFHHVGMVVRSVSIAEKLCRERLKDNEPLVWGLLVNFLKPLEGLLVEVVQEPKSKS